MAENNTKPYASLPDWEKKLRRAGEAKRKAKEKEKRLLNRRCFKIGEKVMEAFPELYQVELSEKSIECKKLDIALEYLKAHPEVLEPSDSAFEPKCTYTK